MALVNPPINGGTISIYDDIRSCDMGDGLTFSIFRQTSPNTMFAFISERDPTTGQLVKYPAHANSTNTQFAARNMYECVPIRMNSTKVVVLFTNSYNSISTNYVVYTVNRATRRVTSVSTTKNVNLGVNVFQPFNSSFMNIIDSRENNVLFATMVGDGSSAYGTSQVWHFSFGANDVLTSYSFTISPTATAVGTLQKMHDNCYAIRNDTSQYFGFYFNPMTSRWLQGLSATPADTTAVDFKARLQLAGENSTVFANRTLTPYYCHLPDGTVLGADSTGKTVFCYTGGVATSTIAVSSGAVGDFNNNSGTTIFGNYSTVAFDPNNFMISLLEWPNAVGVRAAYDRSTPILQPLRIRTRFFSKDANGNWVVSTRSSATGGYQIDLPFNADWGKMLPGNEGYSLKSDGTFEFKFVRGESQASYNSNGTIAAYGSSKMYDIYTYTVGSSSPIVFTSGTDLGSYSSGASVSFSAAATSSAGSVTGYRVVGGSLPLGLTLNVTTGTITGTSSATDACCVTIEATDNSGNVANKTFWISGPVSTNKLFTSTTYTGTNQSYYELNVGTNTLKQNVLLWFKQIDGVNNHVLIDSIRGETSTLSTNTTAAAVVATGSSSEVRYFTPTGPMLSYSNTANQSPNTYNVWTFAKQRKFFDIVKYTGNGVQGRAIPHTLGSAPGMIIIKSLSAASSWVAYHRGVGASKWLAVNSNGAALGPNNNLFNSTEPTNSVFTVGSAAIVNNLGEDFIAYVFAHDTSANGLIQCGMTTGTGFATLPVTLGWQPRFIMLKNANAVSSWFAFDTTRGLSTTNSASDRFLRFDASNGEGTGNYVNVDSTGFTLTNSANTTSGAQTIYMVIR